MVRQRLLTAGAVLLSLALVALGLWLALRVETPETQRSPVSTPATLPTAIPTVAPSPPPASTPPTTLSFSLPIEIVLMTVGLLLLAGGMLIIGLIRQATRRGALAERERMKQVIHDGLQQKVVSMQMQLEAIEDYPELAPQLVARLTEESQILLQEMRAVVHGPEFIAVEFEREIERAVQTLESSNVPVLRRTIGEPWPLSAATAYELGMIVRESLVNALKHAGRDGTGVLLFLHFAPDQLEVEIADTGQGFDSAQVGEGAGLQGIQERVRRLRGHLDVQSEVGRGTTVRVVVPRRG